MGNFTSRSVDVCARCDEVVVKIGGEILILTSEGTPDLVPVVSSGYPIACDHFQCQKNDTTDGGVSEFQMTLTGDRFGRKFYLCARKDESGRLLLCLDEKPLGSKWILRETSGGEYVVESDSFPGFCLINENSEVSLKQVSVSCRPTNFRVEMFSFQERRTDDEHSDVKTSCTMTSGGVKCVVEVEGADKSTSLEFGQLVSAFRVVRHCKH